MMLVNIGCGSVFHPDWINLDAQPSSPRVRRWDVRHGLPLETGTASACYSSHVLEHLSRTEAEGFLAECNRALRRGGTVRIVVPDLEGIARHYLRLLERACTGDKQAAVDYDWIMLEMLDQMVRAQSGGEMYRYLTSGRVPNKDFVVGRIGLEAEALLNSAATCEEAPMAKPPGRVRGSITWLAQRLSAGVAGSLLGKAGYEAVREGVFRRSGQVHLWMYDRFSLGRLLEHAGFRDVQRCTATESRIPGFADYQLDTLDGRVRKPDSLFMEATKP